MHGEKKRFPIERTPYIIAEVASAHQGRVAQCRRLIEEAGRAGADGVKFQFYKYDVLSTPFYQKIEVHKRIHFTAEERTQFVQWACEKGLDVWIDIFDRWGLALAERNRDMLFGVKIPPTVIMDPSLVRDILTLDLPTLLGVGGYEDADIAFVLAALEDHANPVLLLYGHQGFPTLEHDTSLKRIAYLIDKYGYPVGYADHIDADSEMALRMPEYALFAGAVLIEKHITLDRSLRGFDYYSSLEPDEFKMMVNNLRRCRIIYGTERITANQKDYLMHATRITATRDYQRGDLIWPRDLLFRRTGEMTSLFPNQVDEYFPAVAKKHIPRNMGIAEGDVSRAMIGAVVICGFHAGGWPDRVLVDLHGVPALERCLMNTMHGRHASVTILLTSAHEKALPLERYAGDDRIALHRSPRPDLIGGMLDAAGRHGLDILIGVPGNCPLISSELIEIALEAHLQCGADYSYVKDAPSGTGPAIFTRQALVSLQSMEGMDGPPQNLGDMAQCFQDKPELFRTNAVSIPEEFRFPQYRLSLERPEDAASLRKIFETLHVGRIPVPLSGVLAVLRNARAD